MMAKGGTTGKLGGLGKYADKWKFKYNVKKAARWE